MEDRVRGLLKRGVEERVFPGCVLLVSRQREILFFEAAGSRSLFPGPRPMERDTVFDLASLTKPLATTLLCMRLVEEGGLDLEECLADILPVEVPVDKAPLRVRHLLCHASGLPAWKPFYETLGPGLVFGGKQKVREKVLSLPLVSAPGKAALYSDLGFMLLEWVIEAKTSLSLREALERCFFTPLGLRRLFLFERGRASPVDMEAFAATEACPWRGRILQGEVHDENAFAMGGHAGHAGLFGTAEEVHSLLGAAFWPAGEGVGISPGVAEAFFARQGWVPGSTWALGWDTPSTSGSSSGSRFGPRSVGHLGFTGTSLWIDRDTGLLVLLLSNRVHPTRENIKIRAFRPLIHDAVQEAWPGERLGSVRS